ncbi:hypothetical protein J3A83DRAFT_4189989 [Scleroderma citrinum]
MAARSTASSQRLRALALYKELHRLGRDYEASHCEKGYHMPNWFASSNLVNHSTHRQYHALLHVQILTSVAVTTENRHLTDEGEIEKAIQLGEYIKSETLALYSLRKYRYLKRMYPSGSDNSGDKLDNSSPSPPQSTSSLSGTGSSSSSLPLPTTGS